MYNIIIGAKFLKLYNEKYETSFSAKEFFDQVYFKLFFDHGKYMQNVTNSKYFALKDKRFIPEKRLEAHAELLKKIDDVSLTHSTGVGFAAEDILAVTSGQNNDLGVKPTPEDVYCSWIGSGFGLTISHEYCAYFDEPEILMTLFEGWQHYRSFLNDPAYEKLKGNQITSWNTCWLNNVFSKRYKASHPTLNMTEFLVNDKVDKVEILKFKSPGWLKTILSISNFIKKDTLVGFVYAHGKSNKTVGYIPFTLPEMKQPLSFYKKLFGDNDYLNNEERILSLYGGKSSFEASCRKGWIGQEAMQPSDLSEVMGEFGKKTTNVKNKKNNKEENKISYKTYLSWLLSIMNNEQLFEFSGVIAEDLLRYQKGSGRMSSDRMRDVETFLGSTKKSNAIKNINTIAKKWDEMGSLSKLVMTINNMDESKFPAFIQLLNFSFIEKTKFNGELLAA